MQQGQTPTQQPVIPRQNNPSIHQSPIQQQSTQQPYQQMPITPQMVASQPQTRQQPPLQPIQQIIPQRPPIQQPSTHKEIIGQQQVDAAPMPPPTQQSSEVGKSPIEALQGQPIQQENTINLVEVEGMGQGQIINQTSFQPDSSLPIGQEDALPTNQVPANETVIEDSLEELKEEYDDAKLNSIIIEQVKELIEIDTNLNNKIEDVRVDLKKEIEEREKLVKEIKNNHNDLQELEKSIDKFIALYELVTNQFNPFVKQDDPETKQKMQQLMKNVQAKQEGKLPPQEGLTETDFHFVTKNGARVKNIPELIKLLETMNDEEFSHHVDGQKNDFSTWILHALKNQTLASKIMLLKNKEEILAAIQS